MRIHHRYVVCLQRLQRALLSPAFNPPPAHRMYTPLATHPASVNSVTSESPNSNQPPIHVPTCAPHVNDHQLSEQHLKHVGREVRVRGDAPARTNPSPHKPPPTPPSHTDRPTPRSHIDSFACTLMKCHQHFHIHT